MRAPAFAPYAPLNVPKRVARDVWVVDGPEIHFDYLGLHLPFPTRMTIIALADGGLWLHSPIQPTAALVRAVRELGDVRFLIAPNSLHYWWIADWKVLFPRAHVHAVPALSRHAKRPLPPGADLSNTAPEAWRGEIDQTLVRGAVLTEAVFFHLASRTLILTDLIENFEVDRVRSPALRALLRLSGSTDPHGKAPIDMQLSFWWGRRNVRVAAERMIAWSPKRVILAHGRWYRTNAVYELLRAFRWTGLA